MEAGSVTQGARAEARRVRQPSRSLEALSLTGASCRVLNLGLIAQRCEDDPDHRARPMFESPALNRAILIKHRLRADERHLFPPNRHVVTKLMFPFDWNDLSLGGRSILVSQKGFAEALLTDIGMRAQLSDADRKTLDLFDTLPSLDPFLLREYLRQHGREVADCYFDICASDIARMQSFVADELTGLLRLAFGGDGTDAAFREHVSRMVDAMLSPEISERLAPLQATLGMGPDEFREGVFCWKGFLYYKWSLVSLAEQIGRLANDFRRLRLSGPMPPEARAHFESIRGQIADAIGAERRALRASLQVYDDAYGDLVQKGHAAAFREFLLGAPAMFVEIGARLGVISHMSGYWAHRFPPGAQLEMPVAEGIDLLREFDAGVAHRRAA